jgi:uncharacterized protein YjlB
MPAPTSSDCDPILINCKDNGQFPNSIYPVILYKGVLNLSSMFRTKHVSKVFADHDWTEAWNGGVYTYDHYHSTAHEVLGFYQGSTTLQLGGPDGHNIVVGEGDVIIIPAGVAHKNLGGEFQVKCVGAYERGRKYDMRYGRAEERPDADRKIAAVPFPRQDPVFGANHGIAEIWNLPISHRNEVSQHDRFLNI